MPFTILVLLAAFLIESIGTYVSVLGLASLFSANPIIIALAIALDIGKLVSVSFLYKSWKKINIIMKSYMSIAAVVLMMITSAGAFGFLSGEFQKAISGTNAQTVMLKSLEEEKQRLQARKEQIDKQISQLPDNSVRGRSLLIKQFGPEVSRINSRLVEIDKELPALKVDAIKKNVEVGPIMYIAEAFNTTPEHAVKWVILIIIFVFDPLAIALLLAGNFLIEQRKLEKQGKSDEAQPPVEKEEPAPEPGPAPEPAPTESSYKIAGAPIIQDIKLELEPIELPAPPVAAPAPSKKVKPKKQKVEDESSVDLIINRSVPPAKSTLEDIVTRDDGDVMIEFNETGKAQIHSMYSERHANEK
jgi:hypothetical protein